MRLHHLIIASTFIVGVAVQGTALADTVLVNTNLPGSDYSNMEVPSDDACRNACLDDRKCQAWTFVKPGIQGRLARCWLKDKVPRAESSSCCKSGTRAGRID
jgi:hypothetical protein